MDNQSLDTTKVSGAGQSKPVSLTLTAALLVGGESRRMGSDKALLACSTGELLWSRQLKLLRALAPRFIWVSARVAPAWCPAGIEVVLDGPDSRGPLSGLCACLARLETSHLLVLAVDMPRMTVEHLSRLRQGVEMGQSLIPRNGDNFEPLCAIYSKSAESSATACLASPDHSLHGLAQRLVEKKLARSYTLSASESRLYFNLNWPEDWSAFERSS